MTSQAATTGLSKEEVEQRRELGQVNVVERRSSRSVASILRANILTRFNAIITALLVVILVFGDLRDALFGLVMIINSAIGIIQELRAKRTLDRLTVLSAPIATVVRDGEDAQIPIDQIVLDDVVLLVPGDQVPVDGRVVGSDSLQVNEALLTGEADPVSKHADDRALSGSFVVSGSGSLVATAVGGDAYAAKLAEEAKEFTLTQSELKRGIDRILQLVTWLMIPTSVLLLFSQLQTGRQLSDALVSTVAGVVAMVPQGLVLLVSMALAVAVVRLGQRNVLVQELPAVETLARVDVVCFDKTGTLTDGRITFDEAQRLVEERDPFDDVLAALAASDPNPNPTLDALRQAYPRAPDWEVTTSVPFSSERKWSGATFAGRGSWLIGAPEILATREELGRLESRVAGLAAQGHRVLLLSHGSRPLDGQELPEDRSGRALVLFAEELRPDAADTIGYFVEQNVQPKVISGDSPITVSAIAQAVGIPHADQAVDARALPEGRLGLGEVTEKNTVFGRVAPEHKRAMVGALQEGGHTVAMTGDGVNDVLALKDADIGIGMGSGSSATRAVSQMVLLDDRFATLPSVVAEGRRVIANMERVAKLFLAKTVYATILAVLVGFAGVTFPFLPRHLTLVGSLTIGIPAFILSFAPSREPARPGFLERVFRFAVPAGVVAAVTTFLVYGIATSDLIEAELDEARTAATITLALLGLWMLIELIRPLNRRSVLLVAALLLALALILVLPGTRQFFQLVIPQPEVWAVIVLGVVTGAWLIHLSLRATNTLYNWTARRFGIGTIE